MTTQQTQAEIFAKQLIDDYFVELYDDELIYTISKLGDAGYATEFQGTGGGFEPTFMRESIAAWDIEMAADYKEETGRDLHEDTFGHDTQHNSTAWAYEDEWRRDFEEGSYGGVVYEAHFCKEEWGQPFIDFSCNYRKKSLRYYITAESLQKTAKEINTLAERLLTIFLHSPNVSEV